MRLSVRPSVRASVRASVTLRFGHFLDPEMCNIALKYPIERKKEGKRGVPLDTKCNLISMEIKVNKKIEQYWYSRDNHMV